MFSINNLFLGIVIAVAGFGLLKYTFKIVGFTGHVQSVERYLGAGSTYLFMKLIGLGFMLVGILLALGLLNSVAKFLLTPLINLF